MSESTAAAESEAALVAYWGTGSSSERMKWSVKFLQQESLSSEINCFNFFGFYLISSSMYATK